MSEEVTVPLRHYPLYATTFTTHRLSPLFHSNVAFDNPTLRDYASRFRDILTGEVLRGVRVGLVAEEEALARVGALKTVQWSLLKHEEDWEEGNETQVTADDTTIQDTNRAGILVEVTYEKATYSAILLQDTRRPKENETPGFSHYPLLLTRMQGSLREAFLDFLSTTFDTRASVLKLSSQFLAEEAEKYLANIVSDENAAVDSVTATRALRTIIKDILLTLSFDVPSISSSLRAMDITISKEDTWHMIQRGQKLWQVENEQPKRGSKSPRPFTRALRQYVDRHMGLQLDNPSVKISRVACGAFILGTEGKIKLSVPPNVDDGEDLQRKATKTLVANLIDLAIGGKVTTLIDLT
jgi:hypothetical protein